MREFSILAEGNGECTQRVLAIPYFRDRMLFYPLPLPGGKEFGSFPKLNKYYHTCRKAKEMLAQGVFNTEEDGTKFLKRVQGKQLEIIYPANFTKEKIELMLVESIKRAVKKCKWDLVFCSLLLPVCIVDIFAWMFLPDFLTSLHTGTVTLKQSKKVKKMIGQPQIKFIPNEELLAFHEKVRENKCEMPTDKDIEDICLHFGSFNMAKTVKKVKHHAHCGYRAKNILKIKKANKKCKAQR